MIYITGDCHGNFERFNPSIFPEQNEMTKEDYVIICGDFGGVWHRDEESKEETMVLDWLDSRPFTTLFVCGNHENFDRLYQYPIEDWHGGKVHKIRRKKAYEGRIQNQRLMEYSMRYPKKWQRFLASQKELSVRDLVLSSERCVPCIWKDK